MEKKEILYILVGMQIGAATMENSIPKKLKVAIWSSNPTPEYTARKDKSSISKRYTYPVFIVALFTTAKTWKQPEYPSTDGLKRCGMYTQWSITPP